MIICSEASYMKGYLLFQKIIGVRFDDLVYSELF